jgi:hypothetical protein
MLPRTREKVTLCLILILALCLTRSVSGQTPQPPAEPEANASDLAKQTQNPVGDVISVPFQFNFNTGGGFEDGTFFNLNIQPVIPIHMTHAVILISRTIVPIDSIPTADGVSYSGFGDIQQQVFLTPAHPGKVIWGIGPAFSFPTSTAAPAKTGTWAGGGDLVLLATPGPFVVGSLFSNWAPMSDSGGEPKTNLFLWQYFVNYNFGKGWALSTAPSITANFDAASGQQWTFPAGGGISRTVVFNRQPMTLAFQYYHNVKGPDAAASSTLRFAIALIYPTKHGK